MVEHGLRRATPSEVDLDGDVIQALGARDAVEAVGSWLVVERVQNRGAVRYRLGSHPQLGENPSAGVPGAMPEAVRDADAGDDQNCDARDDQVSALRPRDTMCRSRNIGQRIHHATPTATVRARRGLMKRGGGVTLIPPDREAGLGAFERSAAVFSCVTFPRAGREIANALVLFGEA